MEQWILLAMAPVFLGLIALEAWYWRRRDPAKYSLVDTLSNAGLALMHQAADAVAWVVVIGLFYVVYQHRVFDLPATWQQVNVSPNFPVTAQVIQQLYPQSGGDDVDGVIAIDPFGLASISKREVIGSADARFDQLRGRLPVVLRSVVVTVVVNREGAI